ncbi:MAG TPA: hypothetical protein VHP36_03005, partial [Chitinispirillaceae bacterium]|nr:hypothetical protein [Chitinispirillaceae bacterium]
RNGFSRLSSIMAFGVMALSQANSYAISSLDTFSQITSTLFGYSCLVFYSVYLNKQTRSGHWFYLFSILLSVIAILCKENAMFIVPTTLTIALFSEIKTYSHKPAKIFALIITAAPFLIVSVAFMVLRKHLNLMPAEIGPGKFNIGLGFNILKNFTISVIQSILPHSSVSVYLDITNKRWINVAMVFLLSAILAAIAIRGIINSKHKKLSFVIILMLPLFLFPVILLNEINELYIYNMTPLFAVLLSIGLSQLIECSGKQFRKSGLMVLFCAFLFWNSVSVFNKCKLMNKNGIESESIHRQIEPYYSQIPYDGNLILVNPNTSSKTEYSIFKRTGFRQIQFGAIELVRRSRRSDFHVRFVIEQELDTINISNSLVLRYRDGMVHKVNLYDKAGTAVSN